MIVAWIIIVAVYHKHNLDELTKNKNAVNGAERHELMSEGPVKVKNWATHKRSTCILDT